MFGLPKIALGAIAALVLALGVALWQLKRSIEYGAVVGAANEANLKTIDRLEADQVINEAIAIADAQERRKMEDDATELERAANAAQNDCHNDGLARVIELRRLQRERDRDPGR